MSDVILVDRQRLTPTGVRLAGRSLLLGAALLLAPTVGRAQPLVPLVDGSEAAASLPAAARTGDGTACRSEMRLTLATVAADQADAPWGTAVPAKAWPSLFLASETVARYLRASLGAADGQLPVPVDSGFNWRMLDGHLHVVAYRDGSVRHWFSADVPRHAPRPPFAGSDLGERMLAEALDSAQRAGEAFTWPEDVRADSIAFLLRYAWPMPTRDTLTYRPMPVRHAAPVAPLRVPEVLPAVVKKMATIGYPPAAENAKARALVRMQYVIDTTGRAVPESIHHVWDKDVPPLEGRRKRIYDQFVIASRSAVARSEFEPAVIGRCVVPMKVEQEFQFELRE